MPLAEYRRKRHFAQTPEPKGKVRRRKSAAPRFVVQKHDASRLHYDFRLELDGVLKSWAVPKGPSFDPKEKRLAVEVEDHPLEYAGFEGTIPAGEYGGGTVAIWDQGAWSAEGDPHEGYRQGKLKFRLEGKKLRGGWTLVRLRRRPGDRATNWLLIKERDDEARPLDEYDVTEAEPASVTTGRTLEEIARDNDRVWSGKSGEVKRGSRAGAKKKSVARKAAVKKAMKKRTLGGKKSAASRATKRARDELPGPLAAMPGRIELQLATLVKSPPVGEQWLHEIKFDGYRMLCRIDGGQARMITRGEQDWTGRLPAIAAAAEQLPVERAILDGEVVALEPNGVSSFQRLQNAFKERRSGELIYFAFDALYLDGHDLRGAPLESRKAILAELLGHNSSVGTIRYAEHFDEEGEKFFEEACRMGLEGVISKRRDRAYMGGRGYDWVKTKCVRRDEFVIGGFTEPDGARHGLGALLVGYYDDQRGLSYAGKVGTGFSDRLLVDLRKRLDRLEQQRSPFSDFPPRLKPRGAHWVKPELVGQVEFSNWTDDGRLRHPSFQGLREDKPATDVTRDEPQEPAEMAANSNGKSRTKRRPAAKAARAVGAGGAGLHKGAAGLQTESLRAAAAEIADNSVAGVRLTHPDRMLYREQGVTKLGLASFYDEIAEWIVPHLAGRPLSLLRCPEGPRKTCFFQKHFASGVPESLGRVAIQEKNKAAEYVAVSDISGIVALVQMGVLEIHQWGSRADDVERPDRLVFDLDPEQGMSWQRVVEAAHRVRDELLLFDLESFVKTSGGKGLHVVAPIRRRHEWPQIKAFCKGVARRIAEEAPDRYTINPLKARRVDRIFIDYLRNDRGATSIAAYSTRAREGAPVSTPVEWKELKTDIRADHFNVGNLPARLARLKRDPWADLSKTRQSLTAAALKAVESREG